MSEVSLETFAAAHAGFDAASVAGGTSAWASTGRPVVTGSRPTA